LNKLIALILLAYALPLPTQAAPVTWDFFATSCSSPGYSGIEGCDPKQTYPALLATLTLAGPDSSGSAMDAYPSPILTGDPFSFDLVAAGGLAAGLSNISTDHPLGRIGAAPSPVPAAIVGYGLAWSESAGVLTSIGIYFSTEQDTLDRLGLAGGEVGTDYRLVGCVFALCDVTGYWVDASLVTAPEPGGLALLASAFGVWGLTSWRCTRLTKPRARFPRVLLPLCYLAQTRVAV
jgi:hypothetical protein